MNPIQEALREINFQIPEEIRKVAFPPDTNVWGTGSLESLDARIRAQVLEMRVFQDMHLLGGVRTRIPLEGVPVQQLDDLTLAYQIPNELTQNRAIVQVYNFIAGFTTQQNGFPYGGGVTQSLGGIGRQINDASMGVRSLAVSDVRILGHNIIWVTIPYPQGFPSYMECRLTDDENLTSLKPQAIINFTLLCVAAVKAEIFRRLSIRVDQDALNNGQQLGVFRELLWEYKEAEQEYQERRSRWRSVAARSDPQQRRNFLKMQIGLQR